MLSALLEILPSISDKEGSGSSFDFTTLLVSAYPDLQPWCVHDASSDAERGGFYIKYLASLLHPEEGNDAAKRDESLIRVSLPYCLTKVFPPSY